MGHLILSEANIDNLQVSNCPINDMRTNGSIIHYINIEKSSIASSKFKRLKVKNFTLTDVTLDQNIDFTNAQVENLTTKNVTKLPSLNLILTGSNVKF